MACGAWVAAEAYAVRGRGVPAQDGAPLARNGAPLARNGVPSARESRGPCVRERLCAPSAWPVHVQCVRRMVPSSAGGREPTDVMRSQAFRRAVQRMWL